LEIEIPIYNRTEGSVCLNVGLGKAIPDGKGSSEPGFLSLNCRFSGLVSGLQGLLTEGGSLELHYFIEKK
jgi:hypothetical protein